MTKQDKRPERNKKVHKGGDVLESGLDNPSLGSYRITSNKNLGSFAHTDSVLEDEWLYGYLQCILPHIGQYGGIGGYEDDLGKFVHT